MDCERVEITEEGKCVLFKLRIEHQKLTEYDKSAYASQVFNCCRWQRDYAPISLAGIRDHEVINHSLEFVNSETGYTNSIESTWNEIKMNVPSRKCTKYKLKGFLLEFIWRKNIKEVFGAIF